MKRNLFLCSIFSVCFFGFLCGMSDVSSKNGRFRLKAVDNIITVFDCNMAGEIILKRAYKDQINRCTVSDTGDAMVEFSHGERMYLSAMMPHMFFIVDGDRKHLSVYDDTQGGHKPFFVKEFEEPIRKISVISPSLLRVSFSYSNVLTFDLYERQVECLTDKYEKKIIVKVSGKKVLEKSFEERLEHAFFIGENGVLCVFFNDGTKKFFRVTMRTEDQYVVEGEVFTDIPCNEFFLSRDRKKVCFIGVSKLEQSLANFTGCRAVQIMQIFDLNQGCKKIFEKEGLFEDALFSPNGRFFSFRYDRVSLRVYDLEKNNKVVLDSYYPKGGMRFVNNGRFCIIKYESTKVKIFNCIFRELLSFHSDFLRDIFIHPILDYCIVRYAGRQNRDNVLEIYRLHDHVVEEYGTIKQRSDQDFMWYDMNEDYLCVQLSNRQFILYDLCDQCKQLYSTHMGSEIKKVDFQAKGLTFELKNDVEVFLEASFIQGLRSKESSSSETDDMGERDSEQENEANSEDEDVDVILGLTSISKEVPLNDPRRTGLKRKRSQDDADGPDRSFKKRKYYL